MHILAKLIMRARVFLEIRTQLWEEDDKAEFYTFSRSPRAILQTHISQGNPTLFALLLP